MSPFDVDPDWYTRQWEAPPREPRRAAPIGRTVWMITATLLAWFIAGSTAAAVLSTWLGCLALVAR